MWHLFTCNPIIGSYNIHLFVSHRNAIYSLLTGRLLTQPHISWRTENSIHSKVTFIQWSRIVNAITLDLLMCVFVSGADLRNAHTQHSPRISFRRTFAYNIDSLHMLCHTAAADLYSPASVAYCVRTQIFVPTSSHQNVESWRLHSISLMHRSTFKWNDNVTAVTFVSYSTSSATFRLFRCERTTMENWLWIPCRWWNAINSGMRFEASCFYA